MFNRSQTKKSEQKKQDENIFEVSALQALLKTIQPFLSKNISFTTVQTTMFYEKLSRKESIAQLLTGIISEEIIVEIEML